MYTFSKIFHQIDAKLRCIILDQNWKYLININFDKYLGLSKKPRNNHNFAFNNNRKSFINSLILF